MGNSCKFVFINSKVAIRYMIGKNLVQPNEKLLHLITGICNDVVEKHKLKTTLLIDIYCYTYTFFKSQSFYYLVEAERNLLSVKLDDTNQEDEYKSVIKNIVIGMFRLNDIHLNEQDCEKIISEYLI